MVGNRSYTLNAVGEASYSAPSAVVEDRSYALREAEAEAEAEADGEAEAEADGEAEAEAENPAFSHQSLVLINQARR